MLVTIKTEQDVFTGYWNKKVYSDNIYLAKPAKGNITKNGVIIPDKTIVFDISRLHELIFGEGTEQVVFPEKEAVKKNTKKQYSKKKEKAIKVPSWARFLVIDGDTAGFTDNDMWLTVDRSLFGDLPNGNINISADREGFKRLMSRIALTGKSGIDELGNDPIPAPSLLDLSIAECSLSKCRAVAPFASPDPIKPAFNGVFFDGGYAASDSRTLAALGLSPTPELEGWIFPLAFIKNAPEEKITIHTTKDGAIRCKSGNLVSRLADAQFPNVRQVLPKSDAESRKVTFLPTISDAVKLARKPSYKVTIDSEGNSKIFDGNDKYIDFQFSDGSPSDDNSIGFNIEYVQRAIRVSGNPTMEVFSVTSPLLFKGIDADHPDVVVMPICVRSEK